MKVNEPKSVSAYIDSLELAIPNPTLNELPIGIQKFDEDGEAAKVVGGSTISFVGGVPKIQQQDVLNSTLLAQLAANHDFDREKQTIEWYAKYREVLENVGWVIENFSFSDQTSSGTTVRMDKVALQIIGAAVSGNELAVLAATLNALERADPNSNETTLFEKNGSSGANGNFQLSTASLDPNNNVQMSLGAFYFKASESRTRFLFFSYETKRLNLYAGVQSVILNEQIYATVRSAIITKLGDRANQFVADLPI